MELDLDDEISEFIVDAIDAVSFETVSDAADHERQRVSRRLPEMWPRVICMTYDRMDQLKNYTVAQELLMAAGYPTPEKKKYARKYKLFFNPKEFIEEHEDLTLDNYRLS